MDTCSTALRMCGMVEKEIFRDTNSHDFSTVDLQTDFSMALGLIDQYGHYNTKANNSLVIEQTSQLI